VEEEMTLDAGEEGKRDGMKRVDENANEHWKRCWDECALAVARRQPYLNTDHIEYMMRELHPNVTTHERRAIGPRMAWAQNQKWIEKTNDTFPSTDSVSHKRDKRTWHSLLYSKPHPKPSRRRPPDPFTFWWRH
jgi:hypothetical protein